MILKEDVDKAVQDPNVLLGVDYNMRKNFIKWYPHPQNMELINEFENQTRKVKEQRKRDYYSARVIFEGIRWQTLIEDTDEEYKISNNVCSSIVRVVVHLFPEFEGMFRMKSRSIEEEKE